MAKLAKKLIQANTLTIEIISAISTIVADKNRNLNIHSITIEINNTREQLGNPVKTTWDVVREYLKTNLKIKEVN